MRAENENWTPIVPDKGEAQPNPYKTFPELKQDTILLDSPEEHKMTATIQRNTHDALAWLEIQHTRPSHSWKAQCLVLQRSARNLPAVYPSAFAAMMGTPMRDRVTDIDSITQGMVGYCDDPNDGNPYGHVFGFRGRDVNGKPVVYTNDALRTGGVDTVPFDWFEAHWGDKFKFASRSLNGFDLILPAQPTPQPKPSNHPVPPLATGTDNLDYAIHRLQKALVYHEKMKHTRLVVALKKEIADIQDIRKRFV